MVELTYESIDASKLLAAACRAEAGAVVAFLGITREFTGNLRTAWLDYEAYEQMALEKLRQLESEARERWPLVECYIVHRLGRVALSEASVAIVVSTPHRKDAFAAGGWLIDTLKEVVPIWKKESRIDGSGEWVHPGMNTRDE
jgi:molybdopterin synthase catalytic subunit